MTTILLIRHGSTEWNEKRLAQGHADIPLNDRGRREAKETAASLSDMDIDAVYASDLSRAVETARPLADARDVLITTDPDLREIDQGVWEGMHADEIERRWPELWGRARHYHARPGGETPTEVRARALRALRRIVEAHPDATVAVVSHGGTMRWLVAEAMGYDDLESAQLRGVSNGGVVELEVGERDGTLTFGDIKRHDGATTAMKYDLNQ